MQINWTTVISSAVVASIIGIVQLIANRYTNRILDNLEKNIKRQREDVRK